MRRHLPETGEVRLVEGPHFRLDRLDGAPSDDARRRYGDRPLLVIPVDAPVTLAGDELDAGGCGLAASLGEVGFTAGGRALIAQPL